MSSARVEIEVPQVPSAGPPASFESSDLRVPRGHHALILDADRRLAEMLAPPEDIAFRQNVRQMLEITSRFFALETKTIERTVRAHANSHAGRIWIHKVDPSTFAAQG